MFSRFLILISYALRDVSKSRVVLGLTIISLSSIFTAVFFSDAILNGFQSTLEKGAIESGGQLMIKPINENMRIDNVDEVTKELGKISNIQAYSVRSYGGIIINYKDTKMGPYAAVGFDRTKEQATTELSNRLVEGRFIENNDTKSIVIGITLADALVGLEYDGKRVHVGEKIKINSISGNQGDYTVVGVIDAKTFHPNWTTFFSKNEMERLENSKKNSEIAIKLKEPSKFQDTINEINKKHLGIRVVTWEQKAGYISDIISAVSFVTKNISRLLIATVFIIMCVTIFINVFQRRRQIGVLKSMGATNLFIIAIYMTETLTYSIISYMIGFLLFMLIHIYSMDHPIPMLIGDFSTVVVQGNMIKTLLVLFVSSLAGSFFPAYMAARTNIADVIRDVN